MEVKELRHRGRLWRLADFVGGAGGSAKPSTDECCGEKTSHVVVSKLSSPSTFPEKKSYLETKPSITLLLLSIRADPSSCNNAAERRSGDVCVFEG